MVQTKFSQKTSPRLWWTGVGPMVRPPARASQCSGPWSGPCATQHGNPSSRFMDWTGCWTMCPAPRPTLGLNPNYFGNATFLFVGVNVKSLASLERSLPRRGTSSPSGDDSAKKARYFTITPTSLKGSHFLLLHGFLAPTIRACRLPGVRPVVRLPVRPVVRPGYPRTETSKKSKTNGPTRCPVPRPTIDLNPNFGEDRVSDTPSNHWLDQGVQPLVRGEIL